MRFFKQVFADFSRDNAMTHAAAVAFYAGLSIAPLIILLLWIASFLGPESQQRTVDAIVSAVGPQAGEGVRTIIETTKTQPTTRNWAGAFGIAALLVSATAVFAQLQFALNHIWNVQSKHGALREALRKRLLGLLMMLVILIVLLITVVIDSILAAMAGEQSEAWGWVWISTGVSVVVYALLFAFVYRMLPDVRISWKTLWLGSLITAILFAAGKLGLGLYLGHSSMGSTYGAAGSLVVLMVWFYYSVVIFFFGAEVTQVYARYRGDEIEPDRHAVRIRPAEAAPA